jgi:hypothetical protein
MYNNKNINLDIYLQGLIANQKKLFNEYIYPRFFNNKTKQGKLLERYVNTQHMSTICLFAEHNSYSLDWEYLDN